MVEEESAACNSIANCNCSVYSYSSVARFGSALHQKHWHRKHLRWAPEQRRAPKAPFSASTYNATKAYNMKVIYGMMFSIRTLHLSQTIITYICDCTGMSNECFHNPCTLSLAMFAQCQIQQ